MQVWLVGVRRVGVVLIRVDREEEEFKWLYLLSSGWSTDKRDVFILENYCSNILVLSL